MSVHNLIDIIIEKLLQCVLFQYDTNICINTSC